MEEAAFPVRITPVTAIALTETLKLGGIMHTQVMDKIPTTSTLPKYDFLSRLCAFFALSIVLGTIVAGVLTVAFLPIEQGTSLTMAAVSYGSVGAVAGLLLACFVDVMFRGSLEDLPVD